ncbi:hypothetical protein MRB53_032013 [Persea americana]|uniref:Uncharacterized protein n=1 Tax=Persea americana TaxID=3435 RepID=A0ACC2KQL8_PERAE|nr:hypothetical protein MRB53_032013 [Persea americana]
MVASSVANMSIFCQAVCNELSFVLFCFVLNHLSLSLTLLKKEIAADCLISRGNAILVTIWRGHLLFSS